MILNPDSTKVLRFLRRSIPGRLSNRLPERLSDGFREGRTKTIRQSGYLRLKHVVVVGLEGAVWDLQPLDSPAPNHVRRLRLLALECALDDLREDHETRIPVRASPSKGLNLLKGFPKAFHWPAEVFAHCRLTRNDEPGEGAEEIRRHQVQPQLASRGAAAGEPICVVPDAALHDGVPGVYEVAHGLDGA